jgi:peptidoglycan hydrolase-like protein with peptidoglycan-binding domain
MTTASAFREARIAALENGGTKDKDATRNLTAVDPATLTEEANQVTEDQIGLDRGQRRDVQRWLTGLGFDTKVTGKFDDETRSVIRRWQAARGYPASGYLNQLQHKALLSEIVASLQRGDEEPESHASRPQRRRRRRRPPLLSQQRRRRRRGRRRWRRLSSVWRNDGRPFRPALNGQRSAMI